MQNQRAEDLAKAANFPDLAKLLGRGLDFDGLLMNLATAKTEL